MRQQTNKNQAFSLTIAVKNGMMNAHGELSEWFKELVLKTSDSARNLGFESLTLRQKEDHPLGVLLFGYE